LILLRMSERFRGREPIRSSTRTRFPTLWRPSTFPMNTWRHSAVFEERREPHLRMSTISGRTRASITMPIMRLQRSFTRASSTCLMRGANGAARSCVQRRYGGDATAALSPIILSPAGKPFFTLWGRVACSLPALLRALSFNPAGRSSIPPPIDRAHEWQLSPLIMSSSSGPICSFQATIPLPERQFVPRITVHLAGPKSVASKLPAIVAVIAESEHVQGLQLHRLRPRLEACRPCSSGLHSGGVYRDQFASPRPEIQRPYAQRVAGGIRHIHRLRYLGDPLHRDARVHTGNPKWL
jgi:hypothetical protein